MSLQLWLAFAAASAVLLIIPGPTILTVISYSMAHGRRANVPLVLAVALGDSTALALSLLGLGALLATSAFWFTLVKLAGGLYLLYLGAKLLRAGVVGGARGGAAPVPGVALAAVCQHLPGDRAEPEGHRVLRGLPAAVHQASDAVTPQLWLLASTFVVLAVLNATLYAVFAASARRLLGSPRAQRRFNLVGGSLLSSAGVWALLARRPV